MEKNLKIESDETPISKPLTCLKPIKNSLEVENTKVDNSSKEFKIKKEKKKRLKKRNQKRLKIIKSIKKSKK